MGFLNCSASKNCGLSFHLDRLRQWGKWKVMCVLKCVRVKHVLFLWRIPVSCKWPGNVIPARKRHSKKGIWNYNRVQWCGRKQQRKAARGKWCRLQTHWSSWMPRPTITWFRYQCLIAVLGREAITEAMAASCELTSYWLESEPPGPYTVKQSRVAFKLKNFTVAKTTVGLHYKTQRETQVPLLEWIGSGCSYACKTNGLIRTKTYSDISSVQPAG